MVNPILKYLLESSLCLIVFTATYWFLIARGTNFPWMRFYLLVSMALSLILPFIFIPTEWTVKLSDSFPRTFLTEIAQTTTGLATTDSDATEALSRFSPLSLLLYFAFTVFVLGVIYKLYHFVTSLIQIYNLISKAPKVKEENFWIVSLKNEIPGFSFFNYIFINNTYKNLTPEEVDIIKKHEMVHVTQYHSLDTLFFELAAILFWFNPAVYLLKKYQKEVHEYIADEKVAGHGDTKRAYAQLLLTLASDIKEFDLAVSFTGEPIKQRILMLAKPRASTKYKWTALILIPLSSILLLSFSYLKDPKTNTSTQHGTTNIRVELIKYCGLYLPSKQYAHLKPMKITLKDNKLFRSIVAGPGSGNTEVLLRFESDSIFSYTDNSARSIAFDLDTKKQVTGCVLVKFETREHANYIVKEGEFSKNTADN